MEILTLKEAAEFLKLHPSSLHRILASQNHDIPCARIGKGKKPRYRFVREKLEQWLTQEKVEIDPRRLKAVR